MNAKAKPEAWANRIVKSGEMAAHQFLAHPLNARRHPGAQRDALRGSLDAVGWVAPVIVSSQSGKMLDGHARIEEALTRNDEQLIPFVEVDVTEDEERLILASFDPIGALATYDKDALELLLADLNVTDGLKALLDHLALNAPWEIPQDVPPINIGSGSLADRFIVPPFSVLDARQGYWQERKRAWLALGIQSELGRAATLLGLSSALECQGNNESWGERGDISVFDPTLCELAYRWFSPAAALVLDPFAGGSVRGIVAAQLGRAYVGVDLSGRQVDANRKQAAEILKDELPVWIEGDSKDIAKIAPNAYDLIFSCPPYADLERYSDDPRDISTMPYEAFRLVYNAIIAASVGMLKADRFACFVVGDLRDADGIYRNFVSDTISAFQAAGAMLYNEAILVTSVGSLPVRAGRQFTAGRKLGKTHQNVLVFVKGDPRKATEACGKVEVFWPENDETTSD